MVRSLFSAFALACFFLAGGDCVVASLPTILYTSSSSIFLLCHLLHSTTSISPAHLYTPDLYARSSLLSLLSISPSLSSYLPIFSTYHKYYHQCPTAHRLSGHLPFRTSLITHTRCVLPYRAERECHHAPCSFLGYLLAVYYRVSLSTSPSSL